MNEQITILGVPPKSKQDNAKRRWENAFQKWSNKHGCEDNTESYGCCGYGSMCDYCEGDIGKGRPCVRALNAMLRETGQSIDYSKRDFEKVWGMIIRQ